MQSGKKEKKLQKTLDAFYMDGAAYLGKYIGMNAYKKSRMQNVINAAGLKMTPETYMAYAYLKAGSIFLLILPALVRSFCINIKRLFLKRVINVLR